MRSKFLLFGVIIVIIGFSYSGFAREKSGDFGFGLYNFGAYYPLLNKDVEFKDGDYSVDFSFEGQTDFIHNVQFTYRVTTRAFVQLSAGYYQGSMKVESKYFRATEERSEWVNLDGENDFKIMPISFGLGGSFLKEGNFDPYASLGFTFFRVKVDKIDLEVNEVVVRDNNSNARISSSEKELGREFIGRFLDRDYATELGYYANLGMNYFFLDNFAVNTELRYYGGRAGLFKIEDADFNIGGFALTFGLKYIF